jgi:hypothetical protein
MQRASTTAGLRGAANSARVGQVIKHWPQAVQRSSMTTVLTGTPWA